MKTKIIQFIPTLLLLAVIVLSQFSLWCTELNNACYGTWLDSTFLEIIDPLYFFALYLLPLTIVLTLVSRERFKSWLQLAKWALPLAFIFIATTPVSSTHLGIDLLPFYRDDAARYAAVLVTLASLIALVYSHFSARLPAGASSRGLRLRFAASIALISAVVALWLLVVNIMSTFFIFFFAVIIAIMSATYALYTAVILIYQKHHANAK